MKEKIFYWHGILGDVSIINEPVLEKLRSRSYASGDLEKLKHHSIYSLRLNGSDRLLFTIVKRGSKSYLMLLEVIYNHDYQKSRFLRSGVLSNYLEKQESAIAASVENHEFIPIEALPLLAVEPEEKADTVIPLRYFNQQFIEFNESQEAASKIALPAMVGGVAGSGKSCVALSVISNYVAKCQAQEGVWSPVLYVSDSDLLVQQMEAMWREGHEPLADRVQFKTYQQLLDDLGAMDLESASASAEGKKVIHGRLEFEAWYKTYLKGERQGQKASAKAAVISQDTPSSEAVYQEFRIYSGCINQAAYHDLSARTSLVPSESRGWIVKAYQAYMRSLEQQDAINPAFFTLTSKSRYGCVVVDEAQDFSTLQLSNLGTLAIDNAILYCLDSHQSLSDERSKRPFLSKLYHGISHIELPASYRCPELVARAATLIIEIKQRLAGGKADKHESVAIMTAQSEEERTGQLMCLTVEDVLSRHRNLIEADGVQMAVITTEALLEEAKQQFKTPLIFTVKQIKGRQYHTILTYGLVDNQALEEAFKEDTKLDPSAQPRNRPQKNQIESGKYNPCLNALFTAFTRASYSLIVCEKKASRYNAKFLASLKEIGQDQAATPQAVIKATVKEWLEEAIALLKNGNTTQATDVLKEKLHMSVADIKAFIDQQQPRPASYTAGHSCAQIKQETASPAAKIEPKNELEVMGQELLDAFSKKTLNQFFKHPKMEQYLFTSLIGKPQQPLFKHFLACPSKTTIFISQLFMIKNNSGLLENLLSRIKTSLQDYDEEIICVLLNSILALNPKTFLTIKGVLPIIQATLSQAGKYPKVDKTWLYLLAKNRADTVLQELLQKEYASVIKSIPARAWEQSDATGASPLYWVAKKPRILSMLLQTQPKLIETIHAEAWGRHLSQLDRELENTSPLYWLTEDPDGLALLQKLSEKPSFLNKIPKKAWCLPLTPSAGKDENKSPLYHLTYDDEGVAILKALFRIEPDFLNKMPKDAWGCHLTASAGKDENMSPLYNLTVSTDGIDFLHQLGPHVSFLNEIPIEAWCRPIPSSKNPLQNSSPLYWLTICSKGQRILEQLCMRNPDFLNQIPIEALYRPLTQLGANTTNESPLYRLTSYPNGLSLLQNLFTKKPDILFKIPMEAWYLLLTASSGEYENTSPFYYLTETEEAIELLEKLCTINTSFLSKIPIKTWCSPQTVLAGKYANTTPLYYLTAYPPGIALLQQHCRRDPDFLKDIPMEAWGRHRTLLVDEFANTSPLFYLSQSTEGVALLNELCKRVPAFFSKIPKGALDRHLTKTANVDENTSPLYYLTASFEGRALLLQECKRDPTFLQNIAKDAWYRYRTLEDINRSPLHYLTSMPDGLELLQELCIIDPNFLCNIPSNAWCRDLGEWDDCEDINRSPLYNLTASPEGRALLEKLSAREPDFLRKIPKKEWCHHITALADDNENKSPFYWLALSPESKELVVKLLEIYPDLRALLPGGEDLNSSEQACSSDPNLNMLLVNHSLFKPNSLGQSDLSSDRAPPGP